MKRILLVPAYLILLLTACHQPEPVSQLKEINAALEKANHIIEDNNLLAYWDLAGKLKDPSTQRGAEIWEPKAKVIQECAGNIKLLIGYLRNVLIKHSDSFQKQDRAIVQQVLNADGNAGELFEKLIKLKDSAAAVFSGVEELYRDSSFFFTKVLLTDVAGYSKADWFKKQFDNCSPLLAVMVLNKIESNVLHTENILATHCNMKVIYNFCGYYKPGALASLDNSVVRSGDTIMVTAGVGAFSREISPKITINGTRMILYERPVARYEFIATGKPGIYNLPVTIEYLESDGSRQIATRNLGYIITDNK